MSDILLQPNQAIEQMQTGKLRTMLDMCARGHPYFMRRWHDAGIDISGISTLADLERLPLTP